MSRAPLRCLVLAAACLTVACVPLAAVSIKHPTPPSATPSASAGVTTTAVTPTPAAPYFGRVLDMTGKPAAGVTVRGYIITDGGSGIIGESSSSIIGESSSSLVSNNGGGLVTDHGSEIVSNHGGGLHLLDDGSLATRTDADGHFKLVDPKGRPLNIEAVQADDVKALKLNVPSDASGIDLNLAYTGSISGKVTVQSSTVTNLEGVDVFIPGTSYAAKTDKDGNYTMSNVPVGTFTLVASKAGLGRGEADGVTVKSKTDTTATGPNLTLALSSVTSVNPPVGGPGTTVTILGSNFGATEGTPFQVTFGGVVATAPTRTSDTSITVKVPDGAASGDVVVSVGGVPGSAGKFYLVRDMQIQSAPTALLVGQSVQLGLVGTGYDNKPVTNLQAKWSVDGAAATVDQTGKLQGVSPGTVTVTAAIGSLTATSKLDIVASMAKVTTIGVTGDTLSQLGRLAFATDGTLYVLDGGQVELITPKGAASPLGGNGQLDSLGGLAFDPTGRVITALPSGQVIDALSTGDTPKLTTLSGTTSPGGGYQDGPLAGAQFSFPRDVAVDAQGNIFVADDINYMIRKITPQGQVSTLATFNKGGFETERLAGLTIDSAGNLYVIDQSLIRKVTADGQVSVVAGGDPGNVDGKGADARFKQPWDLVADGTKALYVADTGNDTIRKVDLATGEVTTVAGTGDETDADGLGVAAKFNRPLGIGIDPTSKDLRLVVSDAGSNALRAITFVTAP